MLQFIRRFDRGVALISLVLLVLTFMPDVRPASPRGKQCPTAAVQLVAEQVTYRDCCGKLKTKTVQRAPKEGEAFFVQCHCADKQAAQHESSLPSTSRPLIVGILPAHPETGLASQPKAANSRILAEAPALTARAASPLTPPPQGV